MKLKFMLEYSDSPFWAVDDETKKKFGNNVGLENLELTSTTKNRINTMMELYWKRLNPIYQSFPSLWSGRMEVFYQVLVKMIYSEILDEIGKKYAIENGEIEYMSTIIDYEKIDIELQEFIKDPSKFADEKGIEYQSKEKLKSEILDAYLKWKDEELNWTSFGYRKGR